MEAKKFLKEYKRQQRIIVSCWKEYEMWKDIAFSTTGCMEGDRVQSSGSKQKMANAVETYTDIKSGIRQREVEACKIQEEIIRKISQLEEDEYTVLHGVYILGMQYKEIAANENKSISWATSMHGTGLSNLQRILDAENESVKK